MTSAEAIKLCNSYIENIDKERIARLLKSDNMLCRHTLMNRILIDIQDTEHKATDIRTLEEWFILGRRIKDTSKAVALIVASDGARYVDTETGRPIAVGELNPSEIGMALKIGVIKKSTDIIATKVVTGYEYSNTYEVEEGLYKEKIEPGFSIMSKIVRDMYGVGFTLDRNNTDKSTIYVPKDAYKAIEAIVATVVGKSGCNKEMAEYAMFSMLGIMSNEIKSNNIDELDRVQQLIREILKSYLRILGYTEQAKEDIKNVEDSKKMFDVLNYFMICRHMR